MVSVIIPVYNVAKYLSQCLDSIRFQTFRNLEIILVNDASTDNSLEICQRYASIDSRFVILNKRKNEGVEKARYDGIQQSTGNYVCFVDSDDWIELDAIERMHQKIVETNADYVEMGIQRVLDKHKWIKRPLKPFVSGLIKQPTLFEKYYSAFFGLNILSINMCGKLYNKSILKHMPLPIGLSTGEDLYFNLCIFPHLSQIYVDDYIGYNYRFGGMTAHYNSNLYKDMKTLYKLKKQLIEKYNYIKVSNCIRVELKNVLISDIKQKILFKYGTKDEIINSIDKELTDSIWQDLTLSKNKNNPLDQAILKKDASYLYEICWQDVKRTYPSWILKRILSKLLTII